MKINADEVYTPKETQALLKVSASTMTRMIKAGLIRAAKVGKQYRILGKEILRVVSPALEDRVGIVYNKARHWVHDEVETEPLKKNESQGLKQVIHPPKADLGMAGASREKS